MEELLVFSIPAAFCAFSAIMLIVWIWTLIDCINHETDADNQRLLWVIIIAITGIIGSVLYLVMRRPVRVRELGR